MERFFIYVNIIELLSGECTGEKFELLDSVKHNTGSYPITIRYMNLYIEPDFSNKSIYCIQDLRLQPTKHSGEPVVKLDSADLGVKKILFRDSENIEPTEELPFIYENERLIIKLPKPVKKIQIFFYK